MTRLAWATVGERFFEAGVDRGVLYLDGYEGVPWNGLISVTESPTGGDVTPYYIDGIKYFNAVAAEEFEATIEAYTYPDEFAKCDGSIRISNGLFANQQPKLSFGLSYRTKIGNDVDGTEHAYRIHLVYNAIAAPTERAYSTISESIEPDNFSWKIVTKPPVFTGYKPNAHFMIDSREVPTDLLVEIENILYGTVGTPPRLPDVDELISLFKSYPDEFIDAGLLVDEYDDILDGGAP
jgi:hypothetical protein